MDRERHADLDSRVQHSAQSLDVGGVERSRIAEPRTRIAWSKSFQVYRDGGLTGGDVVARLVSPNADLNVTGVYTDQVRLTENAVGKFNANEREGVGAERRDTPAAGPGFHQLALAPQPKAITRPQ